MTVFSQSLGDDGFKTGAMKPISGSFKPMNTAAWCARINVCSYFVMRTPWSPPVRLPSQIDTDGGRRTARNMLKPTGIPQKAWVQEQWAPRDDYPEWVTEAAAPCVIVGETSHRKYPIFSPDGSLPDSVGALILTDRGIRRLLPEELAKAKGAPTEWISQGLGTRAINHLTSLHLWAAVAASIDNSTTPRVPLRDSTPAVPLDEEPV